MRDLDRFGLRCHTPCMPSTTAKRNRPVVAVTLDPRIREQLQALVASSGQSFSRVLELVLRGHLTLPLP